MNSHPLQTAIKRANNNGRKAVIPFITAGFPEPGEFWNVLKDINDAGADIIEIGVPFSDPVADGPVIEEASRKAIEEGITLSWIMEGLIERAGQFSSQLVLMGYANPFLQYGLERLAKDCSLAGVSGFIIPDLQLDESGPFRAAFDPENLALISLVSPNTPLERMKQYAASARGFVYITAVLGITGGTSNLTDVVAETITRARQAFSIPLALGFGLKEPGQLDELPENARPDAAIIGSALLKHIAAGGNAGEFLAPWLE